MTHGSLSRVRMSLRLTQGPDLIPPGELLVHGDLAEQALEGLVRAPHYKTLTVSHVAVPVADVMSEDGRLAGQALFGEIFDILFRRSGRSYGRTRRDGIVGWLSDDVLKAGAKRALFRVSSLEAALPFNALVQGDEGVQSEHLVDVGQFENDLVAVAERYVGIAFGAGQRSSVAVDGIGLVQQVLFACGHAAPREASELAKLGLDIDLEQAQAGDLVVWAKNGTGHAAIMSDEQYLVHASPVTGSVVKEQLADVAAGLSVDGYEAPVLRRL